MSKILYQVKLKDGVKKGLAQRDLVNEVVLDYIKSHPSSTLADLQKAFPKQVQKKLEIVVDEAEAHKLNTSRKQYHIFEDVKLPNGKAIAVCNQWGQANIGNFLNHARQLGYQIGVDGENIAVNDTNGEERFDLSKLDLPEIEFDFSDVELNQPKPLQSTATLDVVSKDNEFNGAYKGRSAILIKDGEGVIFFLLKERGNQRVYAYPTNGSTTADVAFDKSIAKKFGAEWKGLYFTHLYTWQDKLYVATDKGIFGYDPKTQKIFVVIQKSISNIFMSCGFAVCNAFRKELTLVNLSTCAAQIRTLPERDQWTLGDENVPVILNSKVYTAPYRNGGHVVSISIDSAECFFNPEKGIELFPVYRGAVTFRTTMPPLLKNENVIIMSYWGGASVCMCAVSSTSLELIKKFTDVDFHSDGSAWTQYGGYLATGKPKYSEKTGYLYDINKLELINSTIDRGYADTLGAFCINETWYILSNKNTTKIVLYEVPASKMFAKDTKLSEYAKSMF